jgi:hypothetical protein
MDLLMLSIFQESELTITHQEKRGAVDDCLSTMFTISFLAGVERLIVLLLLVHHFLKTPSGFLIQKFVLMETP